MDKKPSIACYALSPSGALIAKRLASRLRAHVYMYEQIGASGDFEFSNLPALLSENFRKYSTHIFICATGIAVRCIAPHIKHKSLDPAVIVCDELGQFAIPILSGHWGGGNALAEKISRILSHRCNTIPVITTATDVHKLPAIDMLAKAYNYTILDWHLVKKINSAILQRQVVEIFDSTGMLKGLNKQHFKVRKRKNLTALKVDTPSACVGFYKVAEQENLLRLAPPAICIGIGCKRGTKQEDILSAIYQAFEEEKLEPKALSCLASVDIKSNEAGLISAALTLGVPLRFFNAQEISKAPFVTPSEKAASVLNVEQISVSEGAAIIATNSQQATLIKTKTKYAGHITIAIAVANTYISGANKT